MGKAQTKPNILFLFPDQHRREWLAYQDAQFDVWEDENLAPLYPDIVAQYAKKIKEQ